jgi:NADH-quinone oxidoreductase subunit C
MGTADLEPDKIWADLQQTAGVQFTVTLDPFFVNLTVPPDDLGLFLKALRDRLGMNYLANITSADFGVEFEIVYHLYAIPDNGRKLAVKTRVPRSAAQLDSVFSLYPTADWQEREIFDLMGIRFNAHPNLVRVLLPDDFRGHPLRKDFGKEGQ